MFDYTRAQVTADRQIARFGGHNTGRLIRGAVSRMCTVAVISYSPRERDGSLIQFTDRRALVSTLGLVIPPDNEQDVLAIGRYVSGAWTEVERLRIVAPPGKIAPAGIVIFWDLQVRA